MKVSRCLRSARGQETRSKVANRRVNWHGDPKGGESAFWRAVLRRDGNFDGRFVYAVRSTGVYCRPSCPSRRPNRGQVVFYSTPAAAERAGFRPCRRCGSAQASATDRYSDLVRRICTLIDSGLDSLDKPPGLASLGATLEANPHRVVRVFKCVMGITPRQYTEARRLRRFKAELKKGANVTEALYAAGYGSSRALYERAPSQLGMTPAAYRRGGEGMVIGYTIVDSALGRLLIAATARGICKVCLGDADKPLVRALLEEYPKAAISPEPNGLRPLARAFIGHLNGKSPSLDLPVDVRATAFQWRVWQQLKSIPCGETRSYSEVARAVGKPRAARAVAGACASNPVAILIPCHRVIRSDGSLGGYGWGLDRKRQLLDQERQRRGH